MGKSGFNLGHVLSTEVQNIFVLGLKVRAGPGSGCVNLGRPSGGKTGGTIRMECLESLDPVSEHLVRRDPGDVRSDNLIYRFLGRVEGSRRIQGEGARHVVLDQG